MAHTAGARLEPLRSFRAGFTQTEVFPLVLFAVGGHAASVSYVLDSSNRLPNGAGYLEVLPMRSGDVDDLHFGIVRQPAVSALLPVSVAAGEAVPGRGRGEF